MSISEFNFFWVQNFSALVMFALSDFQPPAPLVTYSYRDLKRIDILAFCTYLRQSLSVTSPSDDPDEIVWQLNKDMRSTLDRLAPLRTRTRRWSKIENHWLSTAAIEATDRHAYRCACRAANKLMNEARLSYIRSQVDEAAASSPRLLWRTVGRVPTEIGSKEWTRPLLLKVSVHSSRIRLSV